MAEILGLPPTDPNSSNDGILSALGGNKSLLDYIIKIEKNTNNTSKVLDKILGKSNSDVSASIKGDHTAILENTQAIINLTNSIRDKIFNQSNETVTPKDLDRNFEADMTRIIGDALSKQSIDLNIQGLGTDGMLEFLSGSDKAFNKKIKRVEILSEMLNKFLANSTNTEIKIEGLAETINAFDKVQDIGIKHYLGSQIFTASVGNMFMKLNEVSSNTDQDNVEKLAKNLSILSLAHEKFSNNSVGLFKRKSLEFFGKTVASLYNTLDKASSKVKGAMVAIKGLKEIGESLKDFGKGALMIAGSIAILGLSIYAFGEAISGESLMAFAGVTAALIGIGWLIDKANIDRDFIKLGVSIAVLGLSLWGFTELISGKSGWDVAKSLGMLAGSLLILAGANKALDALGFATSSVKNSIGIAAMGASLWVFAKGLSELDTIQLSLGRSLELGAILVGTAAALAIIGNPVTAPFTLIGAGMAAAIGAGLFILTSGIKSVEGTSVSEESIDSFGMAIRGITRTFTDIADPLSLPALIIGLAQAAVVSGSAIMMSGALFTVSSVSSRINLDSIENFKICAMGMGDVFEDYGGIIRLAKITAGAGVATIASVASIAIAGSIRAFTAISSNPDSVNNAMMSLRNFLHGMANALPEDGNFKGIEKGISSFFGVAGLAAEIASSVSAISNLTFYDKEVQNGKVVITGVRKFTPADFSRVGESIGSIITALTNPLKAIGSEGGFFSGNKVQKGIEALKDIGNVFNPLTNLVSTFAKNNIDEEFSNKFGKNLNILLGGISGGLMGFDKITEDQQNKMHTGIKSITGLVYNISKDKFEKGVSNFGQMAASVVDIKNSINDIDLEKLTTLNDLVFNIKQTEEIEGFENLTEVLEKLVKALSKNINNSIQGAPSSNNTVNNTQNTNKSTEINDTSELIEAFNTGNIDVVEAIEALKDYLSSGFMKVRIDQPGLF